MRVCVCEDMVACTAVVCVGMHAHEGLVTLWVNTYRGLLSSCNRQ